MKTTKTRKTARPGTRKAAALAAAKDIATRDHLKIETLQARGSDRLDFHEISVWALAAALEVAFEAGYVAGEASR